MNKRLDLLYEMIPSDGLGVIDVGTDHGQIPIRLANSGYTGYIFASDVAEGPLNTARSAAHAATRFIFYTVMDWTYARTKTSPTF